MIYTSYLNKGIRQGYKRHCKTDLAVLWPALLVTRPAWTQGQKKPSNKSEQFEKQSKNPVFHSLSLFFN